MKDDGALAKVLASIDPETICEDLGVDYRMTHGSSGAQLNIRECPRCGGQDWKVFLNAETGLGNCFHGSCAGEPGFNLFSFVKATKSGSAKETVSYFKKFAEAAAWTPKRARAQLPARALEGESKMPRSKRIAGTPAEPYLLDRGFGADAVERFGWSFCESGSFEYVSDAGEHLSQSYSNRVIIPVKDLDGSVVTFQGRDITGEHSKKYLFPPGLPGSGRFLYNANTLIGTPSVILGEGVFDVAAISMAFAGENSIGAIGSFGKSLSGGTSSEQNDQVSRLLKLKKAGMKRLTFMWDGESAAIVDACKNAQTIMALGIDTYIAILPKDKDPNEISAEAIRAAYLNAVRATKGSIARLVIQHSR